MSEDRIERFRRMLASSPGNPLARFSLANALLEAGRYEEAAVEYRACVAAQEDWMAAHISLGRCLVRTGRHDEARAVLEGARRLAIRQGHSGPQEEIRDLLAEIPG